jgi:hypothetical protein
MGKKNITQAEIDSAKKEHLKAKAKRNKVIARGFNFLLAGGNIAITVFLTILNSDPQIGHYVLGAFSGITALYFTIKTIWE